MANTIQIKRGNSEPPAGTLLDGELGFDKANYQLYIGKVAGGNSTTVKIGLKNGVGYNEENQETAVVPLNADTLQGLSASAFAPAGYGLGVNFSPDITKENIDTTLENGWYWFYDPSVAIVPGIASSYGIIHVVSSGRMTYQTFYSAQTPGFVVRRYLTELDNTDSWSGWEYENPPMELGVEYRTTERFNGKPVYTKVLTYIISEIGSSNGVTDVEIPHNISDFDSIVRCNATCSGTFTLPYMYGANCNTSVYQVTATNIVMRIINDIWHSGVFVFTIHYTKA